ncbi:MAG: hypothetical protein JJ979_19445, partial [Roseibium sp.]|nr:hypothetical protein [Roseibium sp.]
LTDGDLKNPVVLAWSEASGDYIILYDQPFEDATPTDLYRVQGGLETAKLVLEEHFCDAMEQE